MRSSLIVLLIIGLVASPVALRALDFSANGYLRSRVVYYHDLDTQQPNAGVNQGGLGDNDRFGSMLFTQERLRLDPALKINDNISIHTQLDILDNVIAGTEQVKQIDFLSPLVGTVQLPGAGGALGVTGGSAGENKVLNIRRAYVDILTAGGKFRLGRQGTQWGLGIFLNDGSGYNDDFGDTFDAITYLAAIESERHGSVSLGASANFVFTAQQDPRISGIGQTITGPTRDMRQFAGFALYEIKDFSIGSLFGLRYRNGKEGETTTTARQVLVDGNGNPINDSNGNFQLSDPVPAGKDGDTLLYFGDLYLKYQHGPLKIQGEYVIMAGKISTGLAIDAIPFNGVPANGRGAIELAQQSTFRAQMAALEANYTAPFGGEFELLGGYASGDAQPLSSRITQYGFRPDYQLGLLLFHTPLGSSPRITQTNGNGIGGRQLVGAVPVTGNFINNAIYTGLGFKMPLDLSSAIPHFNFAKAGIKFITAWAPSNNVDIDFAEITTLASLPRVVNNKKWYGVEVDGTFEIKVYDHVHFDLTGAYLLPGSAYDVSVVPFSPANLAQVNAIPFDKANWVWGMRSNVIIDF